MARPFCLAAFFLAGSIAFAADAPRVLVVQQREPVKEERDPNVHTADYLATELSNSGLLNPIVWGMGDPVFREAALQGKLKRVPEKPSVEDALEAGSQLRVEYVLWMHAVKDGARVKGKTQLFRNRRQIWKDERSLSVQIAGAQSDTDAGKSLARTWMIAMAAKPLKDLKPVIKVETPPMLPGQGTTTTTPPVTPVDPPVNPDPKQPTDNTVLKRDVAALLAAGRHSEAVLRLRDAVDQEPMSLERRLLLIEALMEKDPALAAAEARRANVLFPDKVDLRVLSARAWLRAGQTDAARQDLNEAVARDPNAAVTRLMLAEISLGENKPQVALEHVDALIKAKPTAEAHFVRGLCRTLLGGKDGALLDIDEVKKLESETSPTDLRRRHEMASKSLIRSMKQALDDQRSLLQRAMVRPKDPAVLNEWERLTRQTAARTAFWERLPVPVDGRASYEHRLLASRLMGQSLLDLKSFLSGGGEDALSESRINLGEASRHLSDPG